jgi:hypothetical protein
MLVCCALSLGALAQSGSPWNCNTPTNTHLICLVPVATRSLGAGNSPAPTFNSAFATQLSQLPLLSSGSGVAVTLDKSLGLYVVSENLGPILTDRAQTIGKHKLMLAFAYQRFRFNSIDGTNLSSVPFVFTSSSSGAGGPTQFTVETEHVDFKLDQYVGVATYGLTDRIDVSVIIPFDRVSIGADSMVTLYQVGADNSQQGMVPTFSTPHVPGSASGIGDMLVNLKRLFWSGEKTNFTGGLLMRFPTGDALNYLGSGAYGFNPYAILSYQARLSPHARIGYQFNTATVLIPNASGTGSSTLPGGLQYNVGADYVLFKKVPTTLAGDFLGNYIVNSPVLVPGTTIIAAPGYDKSPYPIGPQRTLNPATTSYGSNQLSIGLKVKPVGNLILYGNVLIQLNNVGLRSNPAPMVGISYTFF